jgi:putative protease
MTTLPVDQTAPATAIQAPWTRPELLAPAGDSDSLRAAVENGADAVYFGLDCGFNARARAANFALAELPQMMSYVRQRGVRGYVTLNTLVFTEELPGVENLIRAVAQAGVSAVLVQDLGVARLVRAVCPDLPIHASTQMTLTSAESIRVAESLGVERVVLARELSLDEIRQIRQHTAMPLEVFVHGALCVAYSGQCLTSESLGGRSANRGQCAQACRLPYELVCDGRDVDLGDVKYLLSPQDLAAYDLLPELLALGVCGFKIEGRLKTAEYVANITRHYRQALDTALAQRPFRLSPAEVRDMELSFSRGFSPGWLHGCDHKMLVPGLSSAKRGVRLGQVVAIQGRRVAVRLAAPVAAGDGVVFDGDRSQNQEQGGRVFEIRGDRIGSDRAISSGIAELTFETDSVDTSQLYVGQTVWKTDDPRLTARLRQTYSGPDPIRKTNLDLVVHAAVGQPLRIRGFADSGATCQLVDDTPLEAAHRHPLTDELLRKQLGRLGGTVYQLNHLQAHIDGAPMVPLSVLGRLRHAMVAQLDASLAEPVARPVAPTSALDSLRATLPLRADESAPPAEPRLHVLSRSLPQLDLLLALGVTDLYADFQDIREYRIAVQKARAAGAAIFLATPRIEKPQERGILLSLLKHGADGILVRNLGGLSLCAEHEIPFVADFSLNATNELSVQFLRDRGAHRVTAAYDLNRDQLLTLVDVVPPAWLEVVVHQRMPLFHMEHCVFCAVLSPGTNKTNCGRPCDHHTVQLRDRIGMEHPLHADVGCRNTLFNAVPQSAAEVMPRLLSAGLRHFRVELLDESPEEVRRTIPLYRDILAGRLSGQEVWSRLRAVNRVGVTRGTLEERRNPLAIV